MHKITGGKKAAAARFEALYDRQYVVPTGL